MAERHNPTPLELAPAPSTETESVNVEALAEKIRRETPEEAAARIAKDMT